MQKQVEQFKKQMEGGRLPHSFLVVGPEKTGKFRAVLEMVAVANNLTAIEKELLKESKVPDVIFLETEERRLKSGKNDNEDEQIKKVKNGKNKKASRVIVKEELDEALQTLSLKTFHFPWKVLIVRDADKMTSQTANGLLKFVEEPPENVLIFLIANDENDVLSTIRSRCQVVRFAIVKDEVILKMIEDKKSDLPEDEKQMIVDLATGRLALAEEYLENKDLLKEAKKRRDDFREALRSDLNTRFDLVEKISKLETEELLWIMNEWSWYLKLFLERQICDGSNEVIVNKVRNILQELIKTRGLIKSSNVSPRVQLENFFVQL